MIAVERIPLSELLGLTSRGGRSQLVEHRADRQPVLPFAAFRDEIPVIVTALLERTAAFHAVGDKYDTEKPSDAFPAVGKNARRCFTCAEDAVTGTKPKAKPATRKKASAIPAEIAGRNSRATITTVTVTGVQTPPTYAGLLDRLKELLGQRDELQTQITLVNADLQVLIAHA